MNEIIKNTFPDNTELTVTENNNGFFYTLSYKSTNMVDTPSGLWPEKMFGVGGTSFEEVVSNLKKRMEDNGYNFETRIWQSQE